MGKGSPPQINVSKIPGSGGIAGALFAIGGALILLVGVPRLRLFLVGAAILGCVVAVALRCIRSETPGKPWILPDAQAPNQASSPSPIVDHPPEDHRRRLQVSWIPTPTPSA